MKSNLAQMMTRILSPAGCHGRLAVFGYHQVLNEQDALRPGEPDIREFKDDLRLLKKMFNVLPLPEAVSLAQSGSLPARAACITFDDGYANNSEIAAPVLNEEDLPATFFIAADAVEDGIMWNDLVIEAIAEAGERFDFSGLPNNGKYNFGELSGAGLVSAVQETLKYLPADTRWRHSVDFFRRNSTQEIPRLMMTRDDVLQLASMGFDIGGHTLSHPILTTISNQQAEREIRGCFEWLVKLMDAAPKSFAYPNGIPLRDFDESHQRLVADCGFELAVSTSWGIAAPGFDRLCIPRIGPWWRTGRGLLSGTARSYSKSFFTAS